MRVIILIFIFLSPPAMADSEWTISDSAWLALGADWLQTRYIAADPYDSHDEGNPFLGLKPTVKAVNLYFLNLALLKLVMDNSPYSYEYNWVVTIAHGSAAVRNYNVGVRFKF